jgi:mono/diheme cytochrome c family protein
MKKVLKVLAYLIGLVLLLLASTAAFIHFRGIPKYEVAMTEEIRRLKVPQDTLLVAEGKRLSTMLCQQCHFSNETKKLTGSQMKDVPKAFGIIYSRNITQHSSKGIGEWTDGELYYFLRTGIHPKNGGNYIPPYMPKFPRMADEQLHAIIAWLRSDDPLLAPDPHELPEIKPTFLVKFLSRVAFKPMPLPTKTLVRPDTAQKVALGEYVANSMVSCYPCHSADLKTVNDLEPTKSAGFYGGGNPMMDINGEQIVRTANITMDPETGIGKWSEADFVNAVKYGQKPGGGSLVYPMMPHTALSDTEVKAIWAYLHTVPKIKNKVERAK